MTRTRRLAFVIALPLLAAGCADGGVASRAHERGSVVADAGAPLGDGGWAVFGPMPDAGPSIAAPDADTSTIAPPPMLPPALRCGRTYDQETSFLAREGAPTFERLQHRDGTSLPADEGGASCGGRTGCDEEVTRLCDGDALTGWLVGAESFSVQGAQSGEAGTGSLVITLEGADLPSMGYASSTTTLPGFVNGPQPAAPVASLARSLVRVRAVGGCVDVRAVTVTCPAGTQTTNLPPS